MGQPAASRAAGTRPMGAVDHVGQGEGVEVGPHVLAHVGPHGQQDALALVVAGPVLVGDAEVARHDGPVDGRDDLGERDLLGRAGQHVAAADAPLGPDEAGTLQGEEDLLEVGLGEPGALGDVPDRGRDPRPRRRAAPARAGPGWRSPLGSIPSRGHASDWRPGAAVSPGARPGRRRIATPVPPTAVRAVGAVSAAARACRRPGPRPWPTRR